MCSPRLRRKFTYICHFKRVEINARKLKKKKKRRAFILIAKDVFIIALAVVVAKAPYIHESNNSILVLRILQTRIIIIIQQLSWTNCLHYKTLRIYKAGDSLQISDSKSIETSTNLHFFNSDSRAASA